MLIRKLKGAAQMVANMLERDKLPARTEAAKELKDLVAETESHIARQGQELAKRERRIKELEAKIAKLENKQ
jgi:phage shock protein A